MNQAQAHSGDGLHVAIIMDGNGRWAKNQGLPRTAGHRAGSHAVRRTVQVAPELDIGTLTLYAFSSDNWGRPATEVRALMELLERYLATESQRCVKNGVRFSAIGRRDRLKPGLVRAIEQAEAKTAHGTQLHLRVALDYSARTSIARAAIELVKECPDACPDQLTASLDQHLQRLAPAPNVDLLIRTGGEQRLSDFLLWECAYAELHFIRRYWPDFSEDDLAEAVNNFRGRDRRFGQVKEVAAQR